MGKTGSVNWMQIKGVRGQIRLVPEKDGDVKRPGPNQRFKPHSDLKKFERLMKGGEEGGARRGGRSFGRTGPQGKPDPRYRRRIRRKKSSMMGSKQKGKK